ncbi:MAG: hypothetical protein ACK4OM_07760 [Alphaproteobacteria bacterium]
MADDKDFIKKGLEDFLDVVKKNYPDHASLIGDLVKDTTDNLASDKTKITQDKNTSENKNNDFIDALNNFQDVIKKHYPELAPILKDVIEDSKTQFNEKSVEGKPRNDQELEVKEKLVSKLKNSLENLASYDPATRAAKLADILMQAIAYDVTKELSAEISKAQDLVSNDNSLGNPNRRTAVLVEETEEEKDLKLRRRLFRMIEDFNEEHKETNAKIEENMDIMLNADLTTEEGRAEAEQSRDKLKEIRTQQNKDGTTDKRQELIKKLEKQIEKLEKEETKGKLSEEKKKDLEKAKKNLQELKEQEEILKNADSKALSMNEFQSKPNTVYKRTEEKLDEGINEDKKQKLNLKNERLIAPKIKDIKNIPNDIAKALSKKDLEALNNVKSTIDKLKNSNSLNNDKTSPEKPKGFKKPSGPTH